MVMTLSDVHTLTDILRFRAAETPDRPAFFFEGSSWSYSRLWRQALAFAGHLQAQGVIPGDRVVIALPNGPGFLSVFFGCLLAGAVAVPVFPGSNPDRCKQYLDLCGGRLLVLSGQLPPLAGHPFRALGAVVIIWPLKGRQAGDSAVVMPEVNPSDLAFIQFTSGTTYDPKGVMLSHRHLLTNVRQMIEGMQITTNDVFVSWLPVYHDMGLILKVLVPFYLGLNLVLLPTS